MRLLIFFLLILSTTVVKGGIADKIIPLPAKVESRSGSFAITSATLIVYASEEEKKTANLLQSFLSETYGIKLSVSSKNKKVNVIQIKEFVFKTTETYEINIDNKRIDIKGDPAGLFYAFKTLGQIIEPIIEKKHLKIGNGNIYDYPKYSYRGLHLDVSRHFFSVSFLKKYLDYMSDYKLNTFHFHLTDDQGWRMEIKSFPKLTEIGSKRAKTLVGHNKVSNTFDNTEYGGYYTQQELRELVAYANERYINIIPEFDIPGHTMALLASYPEYSCFPENRIETAQRWGIFDHVICVSKDSTMKMVKAVLDEVISVFPSQYIHIGGDEVRTSIWNKCPNCQKYKHENNLEKDIDLEHDFILKVIGYLHSRGRKAIGWDEIVNDRLPKENVIVSCWRGSKYAIPAIQKGYNVILNSGDMGLYFDHKQSKKTENEPLSIGGLSTLEKIYKAKYQISEEQKKQVVGVQANVWTEYISSENKIEYMLFPRIYALSEVAWSSPSISHWNNFNDVRVPKHLKICIAKNIVFRVPEAYGLKDTTVQGSKFLIPNTVRASVDEAKLIFSVGDKRPDIYDKELLPNQVFYAEKDSVMKINVSVLTDNNLISNPVQIIIDNK